MRKKYIVMGYIYIFYVISKKALFFIKRANLVIRLIRSRIRVKNSNFFYAREVNEEQR